MSVLRPQTHFTFSEKQRKLQTHTSLICMYMYVSIHAYTNARNYEFNLHEH